MNETLPESDKTSEQPELKDIEWVELDQAVRRWIVTTKFEQDLENYQKLKDLY